MTADEGGLGTAELFELARRTGREAAAFVRDSRPPGRVDVAATKSSPTDVVTQIDRSCEELIRRLLIGARPQDGFVGEEGQDVPTQSGVVWVVDPIDGTVNFVYGIACYAVSIAAQVDGESIVGHVINIPSGQEWGAIRGQGAWAFEGEERRRLFATASVSLSHALVATGFNYVPQVRSKQAAAMARFLPMIRDIRRTGSAALDLCALAEGHVDAYVEEGLKAWDLAAGGLIATEAGLVVGGLEGPPDERMVIAAHPAVAEEYLRAVRACGF